MGDEAAGIRPSLAPERETVCEGFRFWVTGPGARRVPAVRRVGGRGRPMAFFWEIYRPAPWGVAEMVRAGHDFVCAVINKTLRGQKK